MRESKYYGIHACLKIFEKRPQDIIRVYLDESNLEQLKPVLKWCAQNKKAYHIISDEELNKVTDSIHHEGVCFLAKMAEPISFQSWVKKIPSGAQSILYLDGVQNPHNLGSILRSAAHFGFQYIIGKLPPLSPSACRVAKGGAEVVQLVDMKDAVNGLKQLLGLGFKLIGTSSHAKKSIYEIAFPKRVIIAIGAESEGLSKEVQKLAHEMIQIPGTNEVESLNIAVATSILLYECRRPLH